MVKQIRGFVGGDEKQQEACLRLKQSVIAERLVQGATSELDDISANMRSKTLKPPFFTMQSPGPQGKPQDIDKDAHWLLMFSLVLRQEDNPQSQYKVMVNNNRKMNVVLQENGTFTLERDDQKVALPDTQYKMEWFSQEIARQWLDLRKYFRQSCKLKPENAKGTQLELLQNLLSASGLDSQLQQQIELYCYSTNAWMSLKAGPVGWKVVDNVWPDVDDEESAEFPSFERGLEEQKLLEAAADKSSKTKEQKLRQKILEKSKEFRVGLIVKNTFFDFAEEQCIDRRRSSSCPRHLRF